jgi:hypothetical protein
MRKGKAILIRVSDAEHAALIELAGASGESVSSYLRRLALYPVAGDAARAVTRNDAPRAPLHATGRPRTSKQAAKLAGKGRSAARVKEVSRGH